MHASPTLPSMPPIGQPESFYARLAHQAEKAGETHLREAAKVGQYVTLGMDHALNWEDKLKYFRHAIRRHCNPPPLPDDVIWTFYRELADLVRRHCGLEALRLASAEDDLYAIRLSLGQERETLEDEAEAFFEKLIGARDHCPEWFNESDWMQLKILRDQWI